MGNQGHIFKVSMYVKLQVGVWN